MKIRHQFLLLLILLAAIPILFFSGQALYNHFSMSQELLFETTNEMDIVNKMELSTDDKKLLLSTIRNRPNYVEDALILADGTILASSIQEFKNLEKIDVQQFMEFATNPNDGMLYQITTLPAETSDQYILLIAKFHEENFFKHKRRTNVSEGVRYAIIAITIVFEIVCIIFAILISRRISRSITFLESNTELLADGKFETPILMPKQLHRTNEITALSKNLETLRLTLKDHQNRRDRLIMGISHDLRTPIAIIKGYTEALNDGLINQEKTKEAIDIIRRKTEQLDDMIESLIDFVKLNSTEWRKNLTETDLAEFLEYRKKVTSEACELFNRNFDTVMEIPKGTMVKMDLQLVDRAFANLVTNAIRYSNKGDSIFTKSIIKGDVAELSISDTGIGIAKEDLCQIYDLFYKASPSRRESGMGIGLTVVKNIIETHGWNINVESELGKGTTFTITIPIPPPPITN